jgi:hypothetical protein
MHWWSQQFGRTPAGSNECVMTAMGVCQQKPSLRRGTGAGIGVLPVSRDFSYAAFHSQL